MSTSTRHSAAQQPRADQAQSLANGTSGVALLHIERALTDRGSWSAVHDRVVAMTSAPVEAHPDSSSLFRGAPAVAFVLHATGQAAYAKALDTLDGHIELVTRERLRRAHERMNKGQLPALREFDLISGLTGLGVYQLHRHGDNELLRDVLSYLVRLCEPVPLDGQVLPGWWTSNDTADHPSRHWPGGHGNLGLAHGISGPLALMSSTARQDLRVPGQIDAISKICTWLDQWKQGDGLNAWWPGTVTMNELTASTLQQPGPLRPSWCYGTPGIDRAQQLAGFALADRSRRHLAETALLGCITSDAQLEQLSDASLCHGWAGLVQASWRMAADAGTDSPLASQLAALTSRFDDFLRAQGAVQGEGLLEGAAGVRLVQLTTASTAEPLSAWDSCLLLDG